MDYRWIALEPIQALQSLIATPVTLVSGRPFLVRGYVQLEKWSQSFNAELEVFVVDENQQTVDWTKDTMCATLDGDTSEYLSNSSLENADYLKLCRNTLGNSINWLIRPEDFELGLNNLDPGKKYFLRLDAFAKHTPDLSSRHSQTISNKEAIQHRPEPTMERYELFNSDTTVFGKHFGSFYITGDAELRVNTLGLRYNDPYGDDEFPTVEDHHYTRACSYLAASYPVGRLSWTSLNVNAPSLFSPPFTNQSRGDIDYLLQSKVDTANAFLVAMRANDINIGVDIGTLYYGMMNAANNEFEGAASDVPENPSHLAVAIGPADNTTGYYCSHELGHVLGQTHKGGTHQKAESYYGWLARPRHASNERRDDTLLRMDRDGIHQQRLPWKNTVDLMSYGDQTWPSFGTYYGLQQRLEGLHNLRRKQLRKLGNTKTQLSRNTDKYQQQIQTNVLFVSGTYDFHSGEGRLQHVLPLLHHHNFEDELNRRQSKHGRSCHSNIKELTDKELTDNDSTPFTLSLQIQAAGGPRVSIEEDRFVIRRKSLDFPSETGMFQALISTQDLRPIKQNATAHSPWLLTFLRTSTTLDFHGEQGPLSHTQLDQLALDYVPEHRPQLYGRIRPSELSLAPTDDGQGFNLRIDEQLSFDSLVDCSFIIEACSVSEELSDVWRTVALDARAGEDIFLDTRTNSALRLTESMQANDQCEFDTNNTSLGLSDENLATVLELNCRTENRERRIEAARRLLVELSDHNQDKTLSARSRKFIARLRIVATRGLDKVIVFDGLLEQSAAFEDRVVSINVDRRHRLQAMRRNCIVTQTELDNENQIINDLLMQSRLIFSTMERVLRLDAMPPNDLRIRDAIMIIANLQGASVSEIKLSSGEFRLLPNNAAKQPRTVYYSFN